MAAKQSIEREIERQLEVDQFRALRALRSWILKSGNQIHACLKTEFFVMTGPVAVAHDGSGNYNFIPGGDMKMHIWGTENEGAANQKYFELRALYRSVVVHAPCEQQLTYQQFSRK